MPSGSTVEATQTRLEKAEVRRKLRSGELTLSQLLEDIPVCVQNTPTLFVIDMVLYVGTATLAQVNHEAIGHGINLALPLGALTARAKTFLAEWDKARQLRNKRNNGN